MLNPYRFFSERLARINAKFDWLGALFARLTLGLEFLGTGYGKLTHHEKVAAYFADLGLPAAGVQAWLVGGLEFAGGALLVLGLLTRVAALQLAAIMAVAIVTAKMDEVHDVFDLVGLVEFAYLALLVWLAARGAGRVSVDHVIVRRMQSALGE